MTTRRQSRNDLNRFADLASRLGCLVGLASLALPTFALAQDPGPADAYRRGASVQRREHGRLPRRVRTDSALLLREPDGAAFAGECVAFACNGSVANKRIRAAGSSDTIASRASWARGASGCRIDAGRFGERSHLKAVLMVHRDGRWPIAAEGGRGSDCYAELLRSETVTGVDPLASEDGIWRAMTRTNGDEPDPAGSTADLVPPDSGWLQESGLCRGMGHRKSPARTLRICFRMTLHDPSCGAIRRSSAACWGTRCSASVSAGAAESSWGRLATVRPACRSGIRPSSSALWRT